MYIKSIITACLGCLFMAGFAYSATVWSDEFDGSEIDKTLWTYDVGGGGFGNGQLEYNTARRENSYIENGNLVLEARREFYQEETANQFTSARMRTQGRFAFKYGTLEARIKLPNGANGLWPAFWLLGNNFPGILWPVCGETDIVEMGSRAGITQGVQNKKINAAIHYDNNGTYNFNAGWLDAPVDLNLDYHLYKLQWTPTAMTVYLDGVPFWSFDITADYLREFHQPAFPILNIAIGGWNYVQINDPAGITAPFPAKMYIDWIRLYDNAYTEIFLGKDIEEDGNFGIFTETTPVNNALVYGVTTDPEFNYGNEAALYIWNNMTAVTPPIAPSEGSACWSFNIAGGTWYGMGVMVPNFRNMKNYSDGYLHFNMATTTNDTIKVGVKSSVGGESWLFLETAGEHFGLVRDGAWHEVIIPLNRFSNCDFQTVHQMLMIAGDATSATNISLDNIWWEPSVPRETPQNGNFGVYTENASHKTAGQYVLGDDGQFFIWGDTLIDNTQAPYEGSESISLKSATGMTWFGCAFTPTIKYNLTAFRYPESKLHFALKTSSSVAFRIGMKSGNVGGIGQKWIAFTAGSDPYGFVRDGAWHVVEIPMSDFTGEVDLFEVSQFFEILGTSGPITNIEFDDICFTGGGSSLAGPGGSNSPPSVSITSPANGTFFDPGDNVTITADATDADGTITKVEFLEGINLLGEDLSSPYSYTWNDIPEGTYIFRAKATDSNDVSRTSSPVTIYVGTPQLTSINISPSTMSIEEGDIKPFTGKGFDQFGQEIPLPAGLDWFVSGGGVIDEKGYFAAVDVGGPYTVTAVEASEGILSDTSTVNVFAGGLCTGQPASGEYTWEASGIASSPTIAFIPSGPGIGNTTLILY
jgi:beta-glucanase (GH16 family)